MFSTSRGLRFVTFAGVMVAAGAVACGSTPQDPDTSESNVESGSAHLDVNDIGGLLGRDSNGNMFPKLAATTFVPASILQQAISFGKNISSPGFASPHKLDVGTSGVDQTANWAITGWRFDPCATNPADLQGHGGSSTLTTLKKMPSASDADGQAGKALLDAPTCLVQLRLIAQPVINGSDEDFTAHLVFTLAQGNGNGVRDAVVKELLDLKAKSVAAGFQTSGVALGVHPALAKKNTTFAKAFSDFIGKHAKPEALSAVAFMGLENFGAEPWTFYAGAVKDGKWNPVPIPAFFSDAAGNAKGAIAETFRQLRPVGVFPAPPKGVTSTASLLGGNAPQNQASADIAHAVNNPEKVNFFTTDCVSCHTGTQQLISNTLAANSPNRYQVPKGVTAFIAGQDTQSSIWNVRNCGYFLGSPSVSYRTANETAEGVDALNRFVVPFLASGKFDPTAAHNPGDDCTDPSVFACFLSQAQNGAGSTASCLSKCKVFTSPGNENKGNLPAINTLAVCQDRDKATRGPNVESGNQPVGEVGSASGRLTFGLSVNDAGCLSRVLGGNFATSVHGDAPKQKNLPVFEVKCIASTSCDVFFVEGKDQAQSVTLNKTDSNALSDLFKTSERTFSTVNNGVAITDVKSKTAGNLGVSIDCSNRDACTITPVVTKH